MAFIDQGEFGAIKMLVPWLPAVLQKQIGCFNHRVVTLVADKPKRHWLCFADYIRQLTGEEAFPDYLPTSILQLVTTEHLCNNNQDLADIVTTEHL